MAGLCANPPPNGAVTPDGPNSCRSGQFNYQVPLHLLNCAMHSVGLFWAPARVRQEASLQFSVMGSYNGWQAMLLCLSATPPAIADASAGGRRACCSGLIATLLFRRTATAGGPAFGVAATSPDLHLKTWQGARCKVLGRAKVANFFDFPTFSSGNRCSCRRGSA